MKRTQQLAKAGLRGRTDRFEAASLVPTPRAIFGVDRIWSSITTHRTAAPDVMDDFMQYMVIRRAFSQNDGSDVIIVPDVAIEEMGEDELQITDHPIEQGASAYIQDHAYRLPIELNVEWGWSPSGSMASNYVGPDHADPQFLAEVYQQLRDLQFDEQVGPTLLQVQTGKRIYNNMVIQSVTMTTNKETENCLICKMHLKQVIFALTTVADVTLTPRTQQFPEKTSGDLSTGNQQLQDGSTADQQQAGQIAAQQQSDLYYQLTGERL